MARNKELLNDRNLKIKKDYDEMYNKKGVRHDWCLEKLSEMYFLNKETIHRILFKKPKKEPKKEIEGESTTAS